MRKILLSIIFICMPTLLLATGTSVTPLDVKTLPSYPYLKGGLNINQAKQCLRIVKGCQNNQKSPYPDAACVQRKEKANASCKQLSQLAELIQTSPAFLSVTAAPQAFAIVRKNYPADGQFQNYIVSPAGQVIDTAMDPRAYSSILQMQFPNKELIVNNDDVIQAKTTLSKSMEFKATIKLNDGCVACTTLGYATSSFIFKKDGTLKGVRLISFSKQENTQLAH